MKTKYFEVKKMQNYVIIQLLLKQNYKIIDKNNDKLFSTIKKKYL